MADIHGEWSDLNIHPAATTAPELSRLDARLITLTFVAALVKDTAHPANTRCSKCRRNGRPQ